MASPFGRGWKLNRLARAGMPFGNVRQDTLEVCLGIYAVELCRLHECIDGSGTVAADIGATEEVVLSLMQSSA